MSTITPDWIGRQGDTEKAFPFICEDDNGPVDISASTAVKFHLSKKPGTSALINGDCTAVDYANGEGKYEWIAPETDDLVGVYYVEVEVTLPDGTRTFPEGKEDDGKTDKYAILEFTKQLA